MSVDEVCGSLCIIFFLSLPLLSVVWRCSLQSVLCVASLLAVVSLRALPISVVLALLVRYLLPPLSLTWWPLALCLVPCVSAVVLLVLVMVRARSSVGGQALWFSPSW